MYIIYYGYYYNYFVRVNGSVHYIYSRAALDRIMKTPTHAIVMRTINNVIVALLIVNVNPYKTHATMYTRENNLKLHVFRNFNNSFNPFHVELTRSSSASSHT